MSIFDISLIVLLIGFTIGGLFKGVIRMVGNLIGLLVGAYIAGRYYLSLYGWADNWLNVNENIGKILSFIILFILVAKLIEFGFVLLEKAFKIIAIIPGSRYINNLLGAALGLLEGTLFFGLVLFVISRYSFIDQFFGNQMSQSIVTPWLLAVVNIILPLLPDALKALQSII